MLTEAIAIPVVAAIVVIRTVLNYFLGKEIEQAAMSAPTNTQAQGKAPEPQSTRS